MCTGVLTPSKTPPPLFFAKPPLKSANCPSPPPPLDNPPYVLVFCELPPPFPKKWLFSEPT